ncbi:MAG TPA: hypothetical protein VE988_10410, partial [Gemmataceae bacterium]|nr:hypothetical protein [Gemmataceae bacterium]
SKDKEKAKNPQTMARQLLFHRAINVSFPAQRTQPMTAMHSSTPSTDYLPHDIKTLREQVEQLPRSVRDKLLPLCDKICHFICLQGRLFEMAQEAVDRLQLEAKYLNFDLDWTRQERDELRAELENLLEGW